MRVLYLYAFQNVICAIASGVSVVPEPPIFPSSTRWSVVDAIGQSRGKMRVIDWAIIESSLGYLRRFGCRGVIIPKQASTEYKS